MNEETVSFLNNIDFENTAEVYETISILFEKNQVLKKAIKEGVIATCETCEDFGICPHSYREYDYKDEVEKLKNQQKEFINHIAEEIADVMVMLEQFKLHYGISSEEVTKIFWEKVDRQLERIKNEVKE